MLYGAVLTSVQSFDELEQFVTAGNLDVLKIVTAWGLPWDDTLRYDTLRLAPVTVVRTVAGDPSYAGGSTWAPDANTIYYELAPWYALRDPNRRFIVELGNEPVLGPPDGIASLTENQLWEYAALYAQSVLMVQTEFPAAEIISVAQMVNHLVWVGTHQDGAAWHNQVLIQALATVPTSNILAGAHAYTQIQWEKGTQLATELLPGAEIWLTEFAANIPLEDDMRGAFYADALALWAPAAALAYHICSIPGESSIHHNPNYALTPITLQYWRQAPPGGAQS